MASKSRGRRAPLAKYAVQRSLVLEPNLAARWVSLGVLTIDFYRGCQLAKLDMHRAIDLRPSCSTALHQLADVNCLSGRVPKAEEPGRRAIY